MDNTKSRFWKVGMIILFYAVFAFVGSFAIGFIEGSLRSAGVANVNGPVLLFAYVIVSLLAGIYGIYRGIKFVSKKSTIDSKDRNLTIIWFAVLEVALIILSLKSITIFPANLSILIVTGAATFFLFQKALAKKA
ncbi:MAG: hypothetical protein JWO73_727 [Candidatus Taylorbacteria bacterium]|nr:hypothetical protein [Candidatus Taylorbacteria bacterium]